VHDPRRYLTAATIRFGAGLAFSMLVGAAVFRAQIFRPYHPAFACLTVGAVTAGIFTLVRQSRPGQALAIVLAFTALRFALAPVVPLRAAAAALLMGLGLFVVALIFDLLALRGWRLGKFLLMGPLVGGVFLALAPITELPDMNVLNAANRMVFRLALGMLIGESVAFGVEVAEWALAWSERVVPAVGGEPQVPRAVPADPDEG
jgi:hypothetical protein